MTKHLSKQNEQWLLNSGMLQRLEKAKKNLFLESETPSRLLYVLRQSAATSSVYQWITKKFILSLQPDGVLCKIKVPEVKEEIKEKEVIPENLLVKNLIELVSLLINEKPLLLRFPNAALLKDEQERLETWCLVNGYTIKEAIPLTLKRE